MTILEIIILRADIKQIRFWQIYPPLQQTAIIDSYTESSYLADQVLADIPSKNGNFRDSYSKSSYLADQVLAVLPPYMKW